MLHFISILNTLIFSFISLLHLYWVFGGQWGIDSAMPDDYKESFNTNTKSSIIATIIVALGLAYFAIIEYSVSNNILSLNQKWIKYSFIVIILIFLIRSIGDFRHFGFFRKIESGKFTSADRNIFSPLCLYLSISTVFLFWKYFSS